METKYFVFFCSIILLNKYIVSLKYITNKKQFGVKLNMNNNNNNNNKSQCLISSKDHNVYCNEEVDLYLNKNNMLLNKKLITISPGGFKGFYLLGILTYIKENYNMDDFIFSGASAGSWNSLFMCYKGDALNLVYNLLDYNIKKAKTITELQYYMKYKLLSTFKEDEFDFQKLFIGVTTFKYFKPVTNIFSDFSDLDDAINCCMASSHIPFITGGITNRYNNMYAFDGGFSSYPYLNMKKTVVHISPSMWENIHHKNNTNLKSCINTLRKYSEFFSVSKNNLLELFDNGYQDAKQHKDYLDDIFLNKDENNNIENTLDSNIEF
uniref:PNPLA domain-containing protein n=1 Tax=viral metagenome TaxID=1070528 RepID=A0A6C0EV36_9ZZZZ